MHGWAGRSRYFPRVGLLVTLLGVGVATPVGRASLHLSLAGAVTRWAPGANSRTSGAPAKRAVVAITVPAPTQAAASSSRDRAVSPLVLLPPLAVVAAAGPAATNSAYPITLGLASSKSTRGCGAAPKAGRVSRVPTSVDLSGDDPPVADEGPIHAGAVWATGYTLRGWWARKYGYAETLFAPLSVYAPVTRGQNHPLTLVAALAQEARQGVDTQTDYWQGPGDYWDAPTGAEQALARGYRLASYRCVYTPGRHAVAARTVIQSTLAGSQPLVLGVSVYDDFLRASPSRPYVDLPARGAVLRGAEAVVAVAYDGAGVWVENEWGARWGIRGYALLSWRFVNQYTREAWVIGVTPPTTGRSGRRTLGTATPPAVSYPGGTAVPASSVSPTTDTYCAPSATPTVSATNAFVSPTPTSPASVTPSATATPPTVTPPSSAVTSDATACALSAEPYPTYAAYPMDTSAGAYATAAPYPTYDAYYADTTPYPYPTDTSAYTATTPSTYTATPTTTPSPTLTSNPTVTATPSATPRSASPTPTPQGTAQVADLPTSGLPGTTVFVSGTGFGAGAVAVYWNDAPAGLIYTDGSTFTLAIVIPATAPPGPGTIRAVNTTTKTTASTTFTVLVGPPTDTPIVPTATPTVTPPAATATATAPPTPT